MPTDEDHVPALPPGWAIPLGVVAGASIGLLVGILIEQLATGLTVGAAVGLLAGSVCTAAIATPVDRRSRVLAIGISLLAAGTVVILAIVLR